MLGIAEDLVARTLLHDLAQIHHHHVVGDVAHYREIVADEDVSEVQALLQVGQQVQDLRLDREIERRDGLVQHQDFRLQHEGPRNGDALALAAREHVGITVIVFGPETDEAHHLAGAGSALGRGEAAFTSRGSSNAWPIFWRGLREP